MKKYSRHQRGLMKRAIYNLARPADVPLMPRLWKGTSKSAKRCPLRKGQPSILPKRGWKD